MHYRLLSRAGMWPTEYAGTKIAGDVRPEEWDPFHELIIIDEMARCGNVSLRSLATSCASVQVACGSGSRSRLCNVIGSGGVLWGIMAGLSIGLPPVLRFGSKYLKDKVARPCLLGEKYGFCGCALCLHLARYTCMALIASQSDLPCDHGAARGKRRGQSEDRG